MMASKTSSQTANKQTTANNHILKYHALMETGDIVVGKKIWTVYDHLAKMVKAKDQEYYYDPARGDHVIRFFEQYLRHSKGKFGGKRVQLELWQKAMLSAQYGFVDIDGLRKHQRTILIVGKKNGKSFLSSGEGLYLLAADGEAGPEVYAVATKREQAKIIWDESVRMRNKSPSLKKRTKATINELRCAANEGVFKALASDSNTMDGLNVHGALMDEIHQWRNGRPLYNIIADGVSAREQPMILITSTAGTVREDLYDEIYDECDMIINGYGEPDGYKDDRTLPLIYELDDRKEFTDDKAWIKANPNLGVSKSHVYLKEKVDRAVQNSAFVKNVLTKEFNIRETSTESWLDYKDLNNTETFDLKKLKPRYGIGGLDLSNTTDLTCATVLFKVPEDDRFYVIQMYWLPEDLLEQRIKEDKIPYDKWLQQGWLRVTPGNKIDYKEVTHWFEEVQNNMDIYIFKIGYDSWNSKYIIDDIEDRFGKTVPEPIIQGPKTFSSPMNSFKADISARLVVYNNNPVLKWCLSNAAIKTDTNDNIALVKTSNPKRRIDGVASLMDAYICMQNHHDEYSNLI